MTWPLMERPARNNGRWGARLWAAWMAARGGLEEGLEGVDEVLGVAVLEFVAVGVVVAEGGDVVVGEGLGHLLHEGGAHGGAGAVAEDEEGDGVVGLEEEGGGRWGPEGVMGTVVWWRFIGYVMRSVSGPGDFGA